jgi:hypothetical protein
MKKLLCSALAVAGLLHAQEISSGPAQLLDPIVAPEILPSEPAPEPARLEIPDEDIISSKVLNANGQKVTIQEVQPQDIAPIPEPAPPVLTAEEKAELKAQLKTRIAAFGDYRMLMLSCTVYNGKNTLIRWTSRDKSPIEYYTAWSNVNFHHFHAIHRFKKNHTTYNFFFGIGDMDTEKIARIYALRGRVYNPPQIPELSEDRPHFIVTEGNPSNKDLEPIEGLHEIYQQHHSELVAEYQRLTALRKIEAAQRAANPPNPQPDLIIRHWNVQPETPDSTPSITKGRSNP